MAQNFSVYKSSAGSGKTTTLVREYLRLSLRDPDNFHRIIALTFTNKATLEMKQRVLTTLVEIIEANPPFSPKLQLNLDYLVKELSFSLDEIKTRAAVLLSKILHNYNDFAFSTLDGFVVKIVRSFAYELKLPNVFDVELDSKVMLTKAIDLLLSKIGEDDAITDYLVDYISFLDDEEKSTKIEKTLMDFGEMLFNATHYQNVLQLEKYNLDDFSKTKKSIEEKLKLAQNNCQSQGEKALDLIETNGLTSECLYNGKKGIYGFFDKIAQNKNANYTQTISDTIEGGKWLSKKGEKYSHILDGIQAQLLNCFKSITESQEQIATFEALRQTIVPTALLSILLKNILAVTEGEGLVHLSEMNNRVQQLVEKESSPFIYERIGQKINHFLVDEFQDTSRIQWQNLVPLLENSLSENKFNMIVGDAKQAIYRWREGDLQQFVMLPALFNPNANSITDARQQTFVSQFVNTSLNNNYRSSDLIVHFNNNLLSVWINSRKNDLIPAVYGAEDFADNPTRINDYGFIRLDFIDAEKDKELKNLPGNSLNEKIAEKVAEQINLALTHGWSLSDIAILARNRTIISAIADALLMHKIPFVSADAMRINASKEVKFIVAILVWLYDSSNQINRLQIIHYLSGRNNFLLDLVQSKNLLKCSNHEFSEWIKSKSLGFDYDKAKSFSLFELTEYIIRTFSLESLFDARLAHFVDLVLSYSAVNGSNLADFIQTWNDKLSLEVVSGSNAKSNSVQLLTFHKAKGLEFKVVINVLVSNKNNRSNDYCWIDLPENYGLKINRLAIRMNKNSLEKTGFKSLIEHETKEKELDDLNLLYVGLTRPQSESYLILENKKSNKKDEKKELDFETVAFDFVENPVNAFIKVDDFSYQKQQGIFKFQTEIESLESPQFISSFASFDWSDKLMLKKQSTLSYLSEYEQKRAYGELLHELLSKVDDLNELTDLINQPIFAFKEDVEVRVQLQKHALLLQEMTELKPFFSDYKLVKKEATLLFEGNILRPDRVVFKENEILILDYKVTDFGSVSPSTFFKYQQQLAEYKQIIEKIHPIKIRCFLLFIGDFIKLEEVLIEA